MADEHAVRAITRGRDDMRRVVIESPFAGPRDQPKDVQLKVELENLRYLRAAMHDCLVHRGEAPFASHGLYTQAGVLDDTIPAERRLGIEAGFAYREIAEVSAFYVDLGMTSGMNYGLQDAVLKGRLIEYRAFLLGFGAGERSYTLKLQRYDSPERWSVAAPDLVGATAVCDRLEDAITALAKIAKERTKQP
jgi:hypothetical protein